jgi:hypothetical protein
MEVNTTNGSSSMDACDMIGSRLLLCIHSASQDQIQMAFDYWARSRKSGEWGWTETVKEIASRYNLGSSALLQEVREAVTAFDLSTRCSSCDFGIPRALSCRGEFSTPWAGVFRCEECDDQAKQERFREEEERAKALHSKKKALLASLTARNTSIDYGAISYAHAVFVYSFMLASNVACESGRLEANAFRIGPSDAMNELLLTDLFDKGILAVCEDSPLDCIEVRADGNWKHDVSRINWKLAADSGGLPFSEVFQLVGDLIDQRSGNAQFNGFVLAFWWEIAIHDGLNFLVNEIRKYRFPEYQCGQKTEMAVRYALQFYSMPQVRNLIRRAVGYAAQLSVSRNHYGHHALIAIPGLIISNVDRAQSSLWNIYPVLSRWEQEPLLIRVFFDRVLRTGPQGFCETCGQNLPSAKSRSSPHFREETEVSEGRRVQAETDASARAGQ